MYIVTIVVQRHPTEVRSLCFNLISTLRNEDAIMVYTIRKKKKSLKYFMKLKLIFQNTQKKSLRFFETLLLIPQTLVYVYVPGDPVS